LGVALLWKRCQLSNFYGMTKTVMKGFIYLFIYLATVEMKAMFISQIDLKMWSDRLHISQQEYMVV